MLIDQLLAHHPDDPYYYELKGQVLFESGHPLEAVGPYTAAVRLLPDAPLLRLDLARCQLATNDPKMLPSAIENLQVSLAIEPNRPFVWRQLAIATGRNGQEAESSLALAEEAMLLNKPAEAEIPRRAGGTPVADGVAKLAKSTRYYCRRRSGARRVTFIRFARIWNGSAPSV